MVSTASLPTCLLSVHQQLRQKPSCLPEESSITSITPRFAASSNSTVDILVFGSNFQNSISAKLNQSGKADINAYRTYVPDITHTQVRCYFNLPSNARGIWNLLLTNPDGTTGILEDAFEVRL